MLESLRVHEKTISVVYATILHCLVDFCCIYYMMQVVFADCVNNGVELWLCYGILYNFVAFAGQLPVGIFGDYWQKNSELTAIGLFFLIAAYSGTSLGFPLVLRVVLLGIGNACFHVGGGRSAMEYRENACAPVGIFVATGAFGVFGGKWISKNGMDWITPLDIILLLALLLQLGLCYAKPAERQQKTLFSLRPVHANWSLLIGVCCILVVVLRSFAGTAFRFPWSSGWLALFLTIGVVLGKATGGILADRIGIRPAVVSSLSLCAILMIGANRFAICGLVAVFLFNMTMPITLSLLGMHFPQAKGTAFGALTFAIFLGLLPSYFCNPAILAKPWIYVTLSIASLILLDGPLWLEHRANRRQQEIVRS